MVEELNCTIDPNCSNMASSRCKCRALVCRYHTDDHLASDGDHEVTGLWKQMSDANLQILLGIKNSALAIKEKTIQAHIDSAQRELQRLNAKLETDIDNTTSITNKIISKIEDVTNANLVLASAYDQFVKDVLARPPQLSDFRDVKNLADKLRPRPGVPGSVSAPLRPPPATSGPPAPVSNGQDQVREFPQAFDLEFEPKVLYQPQKSSTKLVRYDIENNSREEHNLERREPVPSYSAMCSLPGNRVFSCGGYIGAVPSKDSYIYDSSTGYTEALPPLDQPRHSAGACYFEGSVYVFGGARKNEANRLVQLDEVHRYDLQQKVWQTLKALPQPMMQVTVHVVQSTFVIGGNGAPLILYNPSTCESQIVEISDIDIKSPKIIMEFEDNVYILTNTKAFFAPAGDLTAWNLAKTFPESLNLKLRDCQPQVYRDEAYYNDGPNMTIKVFNFRELSLRDL